MKKTLAILSLAIALAAIATPYVIIRGDSMVAAKHVIIRGDSIQNEVIIRGDDLVAAIAPRVIIRGDAASA